MPTSADVPTGVQLTSLDPRFREDPYPLLALLRERDPVHRDTQLNQLVFTRHDDVAWILRHPDLWTDPRKGNPGSFAREFLAKGDEEPLLLMMDEPGHRRLRELIRHPFMPRAIEGWRSRTRAVAERMIDELEDGEFELMERVAGPIPTIVIAELLGIDPAMHGQFKEWSDGVGAVAFNPASGPEAIAAGEDAQAGLDGFFRSEIARRRHSPGEDLISAMVAAEESGDRLSDEEIVSTCNLLLLAGNLTTTDVFGNGVMALLRHPDELDKLRARPELMANAVEEILRYDAPVTNSGRIAHRDLEIAGVEVVQGESLCCSLAAATLQ